MINWSSGTWVYPGHLLQVNDVIRDSGQIHRRGFCTMIPVYQFSRDPSWVQEVEPVFVPHVVSSWWMGSGCLVTTQERWTFCVCCVSTVLTVLWLPFLSCYVKGVKMVSRIRVPVGLPGDMMIDFPPPVSPCEYSHRPSPRHLHLLPHHLPEW